MKKVNYYLLFSLLLTGDLLFAQPCPPPGFPPTGDFCATAPPLCVDLNGYCATLGTNNQQQGFPGCNGNALNNDEWFSFIAGSPNISLLITPSNCQNPSNNGMQGAIYEGSCDGDPVATQCDCTDAPFVLAGNFVVGQSYFVVFDGCAGDICDFTVTLQQGTTVPVPPAAPSGIFGPTSVCPGSTATYTVGNPDEATFTWSVVPASAGSISGSPGGEVMVNWTSQPNPQTVQLCVTSSNICQTGPQLCLPVSIAPIPPTNEGPINLCSGESVVCAGTTFSAGTPPGGSPVTLQSYLGCDSVVICIINQISPIVTNLGQRTLCFPDFLSICGVPYQGTDQFLTHVCPGASWRGCDSTVLVDLAILNPNSLIEVPGVVGCGPNAEIVLDASGSEFSLVNGGVVNLLWTGPGIVGPNNGQTVVIDAAGQYCFTITSSRNNVSCTSQSCVTVTDDIDLPQQPIVSGPLNPCQGSTQVYSVTPVGSPAPTGYAWTVPPGIVYTDISPTSIAVTWPANATPGTVCVAAQNDCGNSVPACLSITPLAGPPVPIIAGPANVCNNNSPQVFTVSNAQPGITYTWQVPPGATFTGGNSASITVNFSGATPGNVQVCVTASNNCGPGQQVCSNVTINSVPSTPNMSGPSSVCNNGGNYTYTVSAPPAGMTYAWTFPAGATVTGSTTGPVLDINFNGASNGQVCVSATDGCGTSMQDCQLVQVTNAPTGTISGSGAVCQGSGETVNLTITLTGTGPWDVTYALNGGATTSILVQTSPHTLTVTQPGTYTLTAVSIVNSTCQGTVSGSATVTENPEPVATLSGSGTICEGSGNTVPLSINLTGAAPWTLNWTLNGTNQAPFQVTASPFAWNIGESQAGTIVLTNVVDGNGCDGNTSGTSSITVNTAPTVSGISADCEATNQTYIVSFTINGGNPATYSVTPLNGALTGNVFTSNPIASGTGYSFVVSDNNNCDPVTVSQNIVLCDCDTEVGTMDLATAEICGNGPTSIQYNNMGQVFDGNDTIAYVLHNGSGLSIEPPVLNTSSTSSVSFNPANMTYGVTYYLSAVVGDDNGAGGVDLNDPCLAVAQGTPVVFYAIPTAVLTGSPSICSGEMAQLSVQFTGVAPWSITYDDGTGNIQMLDGITQNPYSLSVSPTATTQYCLVSVEDNNCTGTVAGCGDVVVNSGVSVTGLQTNCNATSTAYTVSFTINGGDPGSYTVTGVAGTITGGVFTSISIPNGTGYSLVVDDANGCDPQTLAQTTVNCDCSTDAGNMSPDEVVVCGDGPILLDETSGEVQDVDDVLQYVLRPDNFPQLGTVLATSSTPEFNFINGTMSYGTTYYVSAIVGNDDGNGSVDFGDPCFNVSNGTPLVFIETPTATLSGTQSICAGETATLNVELTGASPWSLTYLTSGVVTPTTITVNTSPFQIQVTPNANTTYSLQSVTSEGCTGTVSGNAIISINTPPTFANVLETCDPTGQTFVVTFQIQGGDPGSYTVAPAGLLVGNVYTSTPLPDGAVYTFNVDDANACGPTTITGAFACDCETDAGNMSPTLVDACIDEMVSVSAATMFDLDANDTLVYYLHTGNSNALGTVIATSATPSFNFVAGQMVAGTTYYISAVAGNATANGLPNLLDPCLDIAIGTPVVFNELPTISIAGTTTICDGESAQLTLTVDGTGPFSVIFSINGTPQPAQTIPQPGIYPLPAITTTTTAALISIQDLGTGCSNTSTQTATVTVNPNVGAGTSLGDLEYCEGLAQPLDLDDQIIDETPGGQWTGPSGVVSGGALNPTNFTPGVYQYTYTVQGTGNCPDDMVTVAITINPEPTADAGQDQTLTCDALEVPIGGSNTTANETYTWTGGNVANPSNSVTETSEAGVYTLTVETAAGCTATDQVEVSISASVPNLLIVISDVSCFGSDDGFVQIDSVWGGTGPYMFSVDGSPFGSSTVFPNLGEGPHTIQVVDAGGCESESAFSITEPVEVTVEIMGNFEGNNNTINLGDELILSILSTPPSSEMDSILWSTQGIDSCQSCPTITVTPTQQTTYSVQVDENGCSASDDITVVVIKDRPVYIPSAFSPNDDGINDVFTVYGGKSVTEIKSFLVFNRWGESVHEYFGFSPNDPAAGWDGTHRGEKMQPAVFTWYAEVAFIDGRIELYKGDVTLYR